MTGQPSRTRIVVAATCFADADPAIRIAVSLARRLDGDIRALLIEDEAVLQSAALPFARALLGSERSSRPVTPNDMQLAYLRDARRIEGSLEVATRRSTVQWSFERRQGRAQALLDQAAGSDDLVLLGYHQRRPGVGEIVLLDTSRPPRADLVKLGVEMARETGSVLRFFTDAPVQGGLTGEVDETPRRVLSGRSRVVQEHSADKERFLAHIARSRPYAVLMGRGDALELGAERIAEIARCPVIVDLKTRDTQTGP